MKVVLVTTSFLEESPGSIGQVQCCLLRWPQVLPRHLGDRPARERHCLQQGIACSSLKSTCMNKYRNISMHIDIHISTARILQAGDRRARSVLQHKTTGLA